MRKELKKIDGKRLKFIAKVDRFGIKSAFKGAPISTILLKDVRIEDSGELATDHLWFTKGKSWRDCHVGSIVSFEARVSTYEKGYKGCREDVYVPVEIDYRLERPTKVTVIN